MELEGARHEGIVVYSTSSAKLLINWSDGDSDGCLVSMPSNVLTTKLCRQQVSTICWGVTEELHKSTVRLQLPTVSTSQLINIALQKLETKHARNQRRKGFNHQMIMRRAPEECRRAKTPLDTWTL